MSNEKGLWVHKQFPSNSIRLSRRIFIVNPIFFQYGLQFSTTQILLSEIHSEVLRGAETKPETRPNSVSANILNMLKTTVHLGSPLHSTLKLYSQISETTFAKIFNKVL